MCTPSVRTGCLPNMEGNRSLPCLEVHAVTRSHSHFARLHALVALARSRSRSRMSAQINSLYKLGSHLTRSLPRAWPRVTPRPSVDPGRFPVFDLGSDAEKVEALKGALAVIDAGAGTTRTVRVPSSSTIFVQ